MNMNVQYEQVALAIRYLRENYKSNPSLYDLSKFVGVSEHHIQRTFRQWAGISPKQYVHFLMGKEAVPAIFEEDSILEASLSLGLSSTSRLHELIVKATALTPAEVKAKGAGVLVRYGFCSSPFGSVLVGWTERGVCWLSFIKSEKAGFLELRECWINAEFLEDSVVAKQICASIFFERRAELSVVLSGTNLQVKVWEALINTIPKDMITYSDLAAQIGFEKAYRAVASAVGKNKIAFLVPCHRVIRTDGDIGAYRWGQRIKQQIFLWEKI